MGLDHFDLHVMPRKHLFCTLWRCPTIRTDRSRYQNQKFSSVFRLKKKSKNNTQKLLLLTGQIQLWYCCQFHTRQSNRKKCWHTCTDQRPSSCESPFGICCSSYLSIVFLLSLGSSFLNKLCSTKLAFLF